MKNLKAIIIDDEYLARNELKRLLTEHRQITVVDEADNVQAAKEAIDRHTPDLIFLDIDLGTKTGFDLLEICEQTFQTIFITAYNEFAIRAFEVNALDYLLKPVNPKRLKEAVSRLGNPYIETPAILLKPYDKILLQTGRSSRFISVSSIVYIEANGDYTNIYTIKRLKGTLHHTIKKWTERLPKNMFFRVHRSYIVNIQHILEIQKRENSLQEIVLKNIPLKIPISRRYASVFKDNFK